MAPLIYTFQEDQLRANRIAQLNAELPPNEFYMYARSPGSPFSSSKGSMTLQRVRVEEIPTSDPILAPFGTTIRVSKLYPDSGRIFDESSFYIQSNPFAVGRSMDDISSFIHMYDFPFIGDDLFFSNPDGSRGFWPGTTDVPVLQIVDEAKAFRHDVTSTWDGQRFNADFTNSFQGVHEFPQNAVLQSLKELFGLDPLGLNDWGQAQGRNALGANTVLDHAYDTLNNYQQALYGQEHPNESLAETIVRVARGIGSRTLPVIPARLIFPNGTNSPANVNGLFLFQQKQSKSPVPAIGPSSSPVKLNYLPLIQAAAEQATKEATAIALKDALTKQPDGSGPASDAPTVEVEYGPITANQSGTQIEPAIYIQNRVASPNSVFIPGYGVITSNAPNGVTHTYGNRVDLPGTLDFKNLVDSSGVITSTSLSLQTRLTLQDGTSVTLAGLGVTGVTPGVNGSWQVTFQSGSPLQVTSLADLIQGHFALGSLALNFSNFDVNGDGLVTFVDDSFTVAIPLSNGQTTSLKELNVTSVNKLSSGAWQVGFSDGTTDTFADVGALVKAKLSLSLPGSGELSFQAFDTNQDGTVSGFDVATYNQPIQLANGQTTTLAAMNVTSVVRTGAGWSVTFVGSTTPQVFNSLDDLTRQQLGAGLLGSGVQNFSNFASGNAAGNDLYTAIQLANGKSTTLANLNVTSFTPTTNGTWTVTFVDGSQRTFTSLNELTGSLLGTGLVGSVPNLSFSNLDPNGNGTINGVDDLSYYNTQIPLSNGKTTTLAEMNVQTAVMNADGSWTVTFLDGSSGTFQSLDDLVNSQAGTTIANSDSQDGVASMNDLRSSSALLRATSGLGLNISDLLQGFNGQWVIDLSDGTQLVTETLADVQNQLNEAIPAAVEKVRDTEHFMSNQGAVLAARAFDKIRNYDPLVLDLTGSGIHLTSLDTGKQFDLQDTGFAQQTSWVSPGSAFLVVDPTNSPITSGSQLLGENTLLPDGTLAKSGFQAIAALASQNSIAQGYIDASDLLFSQLRLLQSDGTLTTLSAAGITRLNLEYQSTSVFDSFGNQQLSLGSFVRVDGSTGVMGDFGLVHDRRLSTPTDVLSETSAIAALPDIAGSGTVYSLHQAMLRDETGTLQSLIQQFVDATDATVRDSLIDQIVYHWAGTEDVSSVRAGEFSTTFDGRQIATVGQFIARELPQHTPWQVDVSMQGSYNDFKESAWAQLMVQSHLSNLFSQVTVSIDSFTNSISYDLSDLKQALLQELDSEPTHAAGVQHLAESYRAIQALGLTQNSNFADFYSAFSGTPELKFAMDTAGKTILSSTDPGYGHILLRTHQPFAGISDVLDANKYVYLNGDTHYSVGTGAVLFFNRGYGQVTLDLAFGDDTVVFGSDILPSDVYFHSETGNDLQVRFKDSTDSLTISSEFVTGTYNFNQVGTFQFADGTRLSISDVQANLASYAAPDSDLIASNSVVNQTLYANGNDSVYAPANATTNDTIIGGTGTEHLHAGLGDQTVIGGVGNQFIYAGQGNDTLVAAVGNTTFYTGNGSDTYVINPGFGQATIFEQSDWNGSKSDTLQLGTDLSNVSFVQQGNDLLVTFISTNETVLVKDQFDPHHPGQAIQSFVFADGNFLSLEDLQQSYLQLNVPTDVNVFVAPDKDFIINGHDGGTIFTNDGNVTVHGGGNSHIIVGAGDDFIEAGPGVSTISGGSGNDVFKFNAGDGQQTISIDGGLDLLLFGSGIAASDLQFSAVGTDLHIQIAGQPDDLIVLKAQFSADQTRAIQSFGFADGSIQSWSDIVATLELFGTEDGTTDRTSSTANEIIKGAGGDETILVGSGNNLVTVATGQTTVTLGSGNNTIVFAAGNGQLIINEPGTASYAGAGDILSLGAGIDVGDVSFTVNGDDLVASISGSSDQITFAGALDSANAKRVSHIEFADGSQLTFNQMLSGLVGSDVSGATQLPGGTDAQVFNFEANQGRLVITEDSVPTVPGATDTISFGAGISASDLIVSKSGSSLRLDFLGRSGDSITIVNELSGTLKTVDVFSFADGTVLSLNQLLERGVIVSGSASVNINESGVSANEYVVLTGSDNFVTLGSGNNVVNVQGSNSHITSTTGNDNIFVGGGNNTIVAGSGDNVIEVGAGNSLIISGSGSDTFKFNQNNGTVRIQQAGTAQPGATDKVVFGAGITQANIVVSAENQDLIISDGIVGDSLIIEGALNSAAAKRVHLFEFADGSRLSMDSLLAGGIAVAGPDENHILNRSFSQANEVISVTSNHATVIGGSGNDVISVTGSDANISTGDGDNDVTIGAGDNTVHLGAGTDSVVMSGGNDLVFAGRGWDTFVVNAGGGTHTIDERSANKSASYITDSVIFGEGLDPDDAYVVRTGSNGVDLGIKFVGSNDELIIKGALDTINPVQLISDFQFADGTFLSLDDLVARGLTLTSTAANQFINERYSPWNENIVASGVNDTILVGTGDVDLTVTGAGSNVVAGQGTDTATLGAGVSYHVGAGHSDILALGGNDTIYDGIGSFTLKFDLGSGNNLINSDVNPVDSTNTIVFGAGITTQNVALSSVGRDLILTLTDGSSLRIQNQLDPAVTNVVTYQFADGTKMSASAFQSSKPIEVSGADSTQIDRRFSSYAENITSNIDNAFIFAGSGNDTIVASGNHDSIYLGGGTEQVAASGDNGYIAGGAGDASVFVSGNNSTFESMDKSGDENIALGTGVQNFTIKEDTQTIAAESRGVDTIHLNSLPSTVVLSESLTSDLLITDTVTGTVVKVSGALSNGDIVPSVKSLNFAFSDGSTKTLSELMNSQLIQIAINNSNGAFYDFSPFAEQITVNGNSNYVNMGSGNDTVVVNGSQDTIRLGAGNSTIQVNGNGAIIQSSLGSGNEQIYIGSSVTAATIQEESQGGAPTPYGTDTIHLNSALNNTMLTSSGNDLLLTDTVSGQVTTLKNILVTSALKSINFAFSDGNTRTFQQLLDRGLAVTVSGNGVTVDRRNSSANEVINANGNSDIIYAGSGTDIINAAGNNDTITLLGSATVYAGGSGDIINGGSGTDEIHLGNNATAHTGTGHETFVMNSGTSQVLVDEFRLASGGITDSLELNFASNQASLTSNGHGELIVSDNAGHTATINNELNSGFKHVDSFKFTDGANLSLNQLLQKGLTINMVGDRLTSDSSTGTYPLTINANGFADQISGSQGPTTINATGDRASISLYGPSTVNASGSNDRIFVETNSNVTVVTGANATVFDGGGNDNITGSGQLFARVGSDVVTLTGNSDVFSDGNSSDTYVFGLGSGLDVIHLNQVSAVGFISDVVRFKAGLTSNDMDAVRSGNDLIVTITGTTDQIKILGQFGTSTKKVGQFIFADGTTYDAAGLMAATQTINVNSTADNAVLDYHAASKNTSIVASGNHDQIWSSTGTNNINVSGSDTAIHLGSGASTVTTTGDRSTISGGSAQETVTLDGNNDVFIGTTGTDTITIHGSNAAVTTGSGTTTVTARGSNATLTAGTGGTAIYDYGTNDVLNGGSNNVTMIIGGTGTTINAGSGVETLWLQSDGAHFTGTTGTDHVHVDANNTVVNAGSGATDITVHGNNGTFTAGAGSTAIYDYGTNDVINGGSNNVTMIIGGTGTTINAGSGVETLWLQSDGAHFTGTTGTDHVHVDANNTVVSAGSGATDITAHGSSGVFTAGSGSTAIYDYGTNDVLNGGSSNVTLVIGGTGTVVNAGSGHEDIWLQSDGAHFNGATGTDSIHVDANNTVVNAGSGTTTINAHGSNGTFTAGSGSTAIYDYGTNDVLNAGSGNVTLVIGGTGTIVNAGSGHEDIWLESDGAHFTGTSGADYIHVDANNTVVNAGSGATTINAHGNSGTFNAGSGSIEIYDYGAYNVFNGGSGAVTMVASGTGTTINGGTGSETIDIYGDNVMMTGNGGADYISVSGDNAFVFAGDGDTTIVASGANASLYGGAATRNITSSGHDSVINIGTGDTTVIVSGSDSWVYGGSGAESVYLQGANDVFFASTGTDYVNVSGDDAQIYTYMGTATVVASGHNDQVYAGDGPTTFLSSGDDAQYYAGAGDATVVASGARAAVYGSTGNETIYLQGDDAQFYGDSGSAYVNITGNNALITTGSGDTTIVASGDYETLLAGTGNTTIIASGSHDVIDAGDDIVTLVISGSDITINAGTGNETVYLQSNDLTFEGTTGTDYVNITGNNATVTAGSGDTTIVASGDNETLTAGTGNTTIIASGAHDTINMGGANATLVVSGSDITINAGSGNETVYLQSNDLTFEGTTGTDYVNITGSNATVTAGSGDTTIVASGDNETLTAGTGNTTIIASGAHDTINMGAHNATLVVSGSDVTINAGSGNETIYLQSNDLTFTGTTGTDYVNITGNNATVTAGSGDTTIVASGDNETLTAGTGNTTIIASGAHDTINMGGANATLVVSGSDITINAGSGNETVYLQSNDLTFEGTTGTDYVNITGNNATVTAGSGDTTIVASGDNETLTAGTGNTTIIASGAHDTINIGAANATLVVSGSDITINAGSGNETIYLQSNDLTFEGTTGTDYVNVTGNNATVTAGSGDTTVVASGDNETLTAGTGNTTIIASGAHDTINMGAANATLVVSGSDVTINAGSGNETVYLQSDNLTFEGTTGTDYVNVTGNNATVTAGSGDTTIVASGDNETLSAGTGNATIIDSGDNNVLNGGVGNMTFVASGNGATVNGGTGSDTVYLQGTNATYFGGSGADYINVTGDDNSVNIGSGDTTVISSGANSIVNAGSGTSTITASGAGATITGGAGTENVRSSGGDATLIGGIGTSNYFFETGYGANSIDNVGGGGSFVNFGASVAHNAVAFFKQGYDLLVSYAGSSDILTVKNEFAGPDNNVDSFTLSDGTYLSEADVNLVIQQMSSYASDNGIAFGNINDVKNSADLMNIIASSWKPQ